MANQIDKKANRMEESKAAKLWDKLNKMESTLEEKLKIFRVERNLPLRKLAEIKGINKGKISRMTKKDKKNRHFVSWAAFFEASLKYVVEW